MDNNEITIDDELNGTFIFYKSYYETLKLFPDAEKRWKAFETFCEYAFYGKMPEEGSDYESLMFLYMAKPVFDANQKRKVASKKGGTATKRKYKEHNSKEQNKATAEAIAEAPAKAIATKGPRQGPRQGPYVYVYGDVDEYVDEYEDEDVDGDVDVDEYVDGDGYGYVEGEGGKRKAGSAGRADAPQTPNPKKLLTKEERTGEKKAYGPNLNVYLTDAEYKDIGDKLGLVRRDWYIKRVSEYSAEKGRQYPDHYKTIFQYAARDEQKELNKNEAELRASGKSRQTRLSLPG